MAESKYYVSNLDNYNVLYDSQSKMLFGLPIMKTGNYNSQSYSEESFKTMINNFKRLQMEKGFEPTFLPMHGFDYEGKPENRDVREDTLGYVKNMYLQDGILFSDIQVTEPDEVIPHIQNKKIRYLSTEIYPDYSIDGESVGMMMPAVAAVHNPAVKGLNFNLVVINSEDIFNEGGLKNMSIFDKIRELFTKNVENEDVIKEFDEIVALNEEVVEEEIEESIEESEEEIEEEIKEEIEEEIEEEVEEEVSTFAEELAQKEVEIEELKQVVKNSEITLTINDLVAGGFVPPASKDKVSTYIERIYENKELKDEFIEVLKSNVTLHTQKEGIEFDGDITTDDVSDEQAKEIAKRVMQK